MWFACPLLLALAVQDDPLAPQRAVCEQLLERAEADDRLRLAQAEHEPSGTVFVQGYFRVPEDRDDPDGRSIEIGLIVLPARGADRADDPVWLLHGGPGAGAIAFFRRQLRGWMRARRDVVLVDQRGTGFSNELAVPMPGGDDDLQADLGSLFQPDVYRAALPALQAKADLTQYTTPASIDDFEELRVALGYGKLNLRGGSYGTRAALCYLRQYPDSVRTATLQGIQPIEYRNPLPHARGAQESIDLIFDEVEQDEAARAAFGDLRAKFAETLARLAEAPATVTVTHPKTQEDVEVVLEREAFVEAVRLRLYSIPANRRLPLLLLKAHEGDYRELAEGLITANRQARNNIAWGTLMCITASEDLWRIDEDEIGPACAGTFLGETRIRQQLAVAAVWPHGRVDDAFAEPVRSDVPVLLWSGTHDPSTTPAWGAVAARGLTRGLHVVIPSGHGVFGPEVRRVDEAFLEAGSVEGLDLSEVEALTLPPLVLPD